MTVHEGQIEIEQDQIRLAGADVLQDVFKVAAALAAIAVLAEKVTQLHTDLFIVFHDQNSIHRHPSFHSGFIIYEIAGMRK